MNLRFVRTNEWMNSWRMRNVSWLIFRGLHRSSHASIPGRDYSAIISRLFHLITLLVHVFVDKSCSCRSMTSTKKLVRMEHTFSTETMTSRVTFGSGVISFQRKFEKFSHITAAFVECFVSSLKSLFIWDHMMPIWLKRWLAFEIRKVCISWRKARFVNWLWASQNEAHH